MSRLVIGATLAATAVVIAAGCSGAQTNGTQGGYVSSDKRITIVKPADRMPAPKIAGNDLEGQPLSVKDFAGKTVVVNVWGSWCPPCRKEAPALAATAKKLKGDGVEFLGISVRENASAAKAFNDAKDIPYPSLSDPSGKTLLGFAKNLPSPAIPTTWIIDSNGQLAVRIADATTEATLTRLIKDVQGSVS